MSEGRIIRRSVDDPSVEVDWARADSLADEEIAEAVAADPDAAPLLDAAWFEAADLALPPGKQMISIRIDKDVLEYFRSTGQRYQSRINAILKAYVKAKTGAA